MSAWLHRKRDALVGVSTDARSVSRCFPSSRQILSEAHCVKMVLLRIFSENGKDLSSSSPQVGFSECLKCLHFPGSFGRKEDGANNKNCKKEDLSV